LFRQNHKIENIPTASHVVKQHVNKAVYQAGHIWGQSLIGKPDVPSPDAWGWEREAEDSPWTLRFYALAGTILDVDQNILGGGQFEKNCIVVCT